MKKNLIKEIGAPINRGGATNGAVTSINGSKPDASGNINVATMTEGEKEAILQAVQYLSDKVQNIDSSDFATKEWTQEQIDKIKQFESERVDTLPEASENTMGKIYLVPATNPKEGNLYDEYITIERLVLPDDYFSAFSTRSVPEITWEKEYTWEKIGDSVDVNIPEAPSFSNYVTKEELENKLSDIESMKNMLGKLYDATFPITIGLSASRNGMNHKLTVSVTESGEKYIPDAMTLKQTSYRQTTETETIEGVLEDFKATSGNSLIINTPIKANRETFSLSVSSEGRTPKSTSITRYICYAGALTKDTLDASDIESLTMAYATGVAFNPSVTTSDNQYIWLVIPGNLSINKVTSSGFDVTLDSTVTTIITSLGTFKAYRTANQLTENTWNLIIS